jgi:hypothetical protein
VVVEFEVDTHRAKTMQLLNLRQTSTVEEYRKQFEQLVYNIRLFDQGLSNTMLTSQFLLGLKSEIRSVVEMQLSESDAKAAILASVQELLLERNRKGTFMGNHLKLTSSDKTDSKATFPLLKCGRIDNLRNIEDQTGYALSVVINLLLVTGAM